MRGTAAEEKIGPARQETRGDPAFQPAARGVGSEAGGRGVGKRGRDDDSGGHPAVPGGLQDGLDLLSVRSHRHGFVVGLHAAGEGRPGRGRIGDKGGRGRPDEADDGHLVHSKKTGQAAFSGPGGRGDRVAHPVADEKNDVPGRLMPGAGRGRAGLKEKAEKAGEGEDKKGKPRSSNHLESSKNRIRPEFEGKRYHGGGISVKDDFGP